MRRVLHAGIPFLIAFLVIVLIESGLRLGGYGHPADFYVPRTINGKEVYVNNIFYTEKFFAPSLIRTPFPINVSRTREDNTIRIAIAGESAALGDPDYSFGFGRILKIMLEDAHPGLRFEMINTSVTAINSHVILPVVRETSEKIKPDVFILYMGNNEVIGPYGPNSSFSGFSSSRRFIKANIALNNTKLGMLARNTRFALQRSDAAPGQWEGMEMFLNYKAEPEDKRIDAVCKNFRKNLEEIIQVASENSKVIVSTVAVNIRDCAPFYSVGNKELEYIALKQIDQFKEEAVMLMDGGYLQEARERIEAALEIDSFHAGANYTYGEILYASGDHALSGKYYHRALDYDALKFRADNRLNRIIREVCEEYDGHQNVFVADLVQHLAGCGEQALFGSELFLEHVHFNFYGNYLAAAFYQHKVEKALGLDSAGEPPGEVQYYMNRLAYTPYEAYKVYRETLRRLNRQPFAGRSQNHTEKERISREIEEIRKVVPRKEMYHYAIRERPGDWLIKYNYALFLMRQGVFDEHVLQLLDDIRQTVPQNPTIDFNTGFLFEHTGDHANALEYYQRAIKLFPYYTDAKKNAAALMLLKGTDHTSGGIRSFGLSGGDLVDVYLKAASMSAERGNDRQVQAFYEKAWALDPCHSEVVRALSGILLRLNEHERVVDMMQLYLQREEADYEILFKKALAYEGLRQYDKALQCYQDASLYDGSSHILYNKAGQMHYLLGNYAGAVQSFKHSIEANPDQRLVYVYTNIALSYSRMDHPEKAISYYYQALSEVPGDQQILDRLEREYGRLAQQQTICADSLKL